MDEIAIVVQAQLRRLNFNVIKNKICDGFKNYSYMIFKENLNTFCHFFFRLVYVCYGILQFYAVWGYLTKVFHSSNTIVLLVSLILAFCPFVGPIAGVIGAHMCLGWNIFYSMFFFISPYFLVNTPLHLIAVYEYYKDRKRWELEATNE